MDYTVSSVLDDSKLSRDRLLLVLLSIVVPGRFAKLKVVMTPIILFCSWDSLYLPFSLS